METRHLGEEVVLIRVFDTETGKQRLAIQHPAALWGLAVPQDGRHIPTGTGGSLPCCLP